MPIYFAQPVYRSLSLRTAASIQKVLAATPAGETIQWEPYWGDALIARARSIQATRFLEDHPECDVMVMIDDDLVFPPDAFFRIVSGARATHSIVAGAYVTHGDKPHLTCREWPGAEPVKIRDGGPSNLVHVEYTATGFMAVHRDVIEAMTHGTFEDANGKYVLHRCQRGSGDKPMYPFFDTNTIEEAPGVFHWLSEDWAFVERANQLGFKAYIDTSIKLEHMGTHGQTVDDLLAPPTGAGTGTEHVTISVPVTGVPLVDTLPADLASFSGQSIDMVYAALPDGAAMLAKLWEDWRDSETAFYEYPQHGAAYALDLAWWHMHGGVPLDLVSSLRGKRVLDIGAGIGTFALAASVAGAEVSIAEPNAWMTEFAYWRARKYGQTFTAPSGLYDAVVCWHVLEHVADPVAMLREITACLRPGGTLYVQADFHVDATHPMHHEFAGEWEAVMAREGYIALGEDAYRLPALVIAR